VRSMEGTAGAVASRMRAGRRLVGLGAVVAGLIAGTGCEDPTQATLSENVGSAFAPCNESEIKYLASKHNFMLSFRACANNNFEQYAWSPDGRLLYFQLVLTSYVMDAELDNKATKAVPAPTPIGPATWTTASRLLLPVGPSGEAEKPAPNRIAAYEARQGLVFYVDLPLGFGDVQELQRGNDPASVYALATWKGERTVWSVDTSTGEVTEAFPWLPKGATSFTYTPNVRVASVGFGDEVKVFDAELGVRVATFAPAQRASLHPEGQWVMLEHLGDPVSIFYQRSWDELSEQARERELRRAKRFEENLPEHFPREVQPPTLSYANVVTGERYLLDSVFGRDFAWYEPRPYYGAFVLWGFEGKQYKRNVLLGDFVYRLQAAEKGKEFLGVKKMDTARFEGPDGAAPAAVPTPGGDPAPDGATTPLPTPAAPTPEAPPTAPPQ